MSADGSAVGRVMQVEVNVRVGGNQPGCVVRPIVRNRVAGHVGILFAATQAQPGNHGLLKWLAWNGDQVCVALYSLPNRLVIFHIGCVRYERNADVMHHSGSTGWNCIDVIQVSWVKWLGIATQNQSTTPVAGTSKSGPSRIISGSTSQPPDGHCLRGGASFGSPSGAPASTHLLNVSIALCFRERSFEKCPYLGSAFHGGILRATVAALMAFAQGRTSL